ncbi:hypothetical protein RHMOL_Rhmol08G0150200 [Rhododendron molle]|uniref:Uncharacterized protein n=1 Tax=Rhododendron molle TaxID=49168 RepID=A0ACC0MPQ7_RHOML|nr:hypothetical protein RHMOL_Rhmol08G0150200 [Rhododendron molle]
MPMAPIQKTVQYCCVSKDGRILYAHRSGDQEIEKLAALCLERTPPYHKWYFQTMGKKTFGFLAEDGYVYFAIVQEGVGNSGVLRFLEQVRDEVRKLSNRSFLSRNKSSLRSLCIQEQLAPFVYQLITSLEHVSQTACNEWPAEASSPHHAKLSPSLTYDANGQVEAAASSKLPLLVSTSNKQEKKKKKKMMMKDHVIAMRDIELEEHHTSTDRGVVKVDTGTLESDCQSGVASTVPLHKDLALMRTRSGNKSFRKKWCRQVRIVLAVDAAVCLVLFLIWLIICGGFECIR